MSALAYVGAEAFSRERDGCKFEVGSLVPSSVVDFVAITDRWIPPVLDSVGLALRHGRSSAVHPT